MEFKNWEIDSRNITLEFREYFDEPIQASWVVMIPGTIDTSEIPHSLLEDIKNAITVEEYPPPYTIEVNQNYVSWGASGASQNLIFTIAASALSGTVGNLMADALKTLFKNLVNGCKDKTWREQIDSQEAMERAKWHVMQAYKLEENENDIKLISTDKNIKQSTWVFVFKLGNILYECEIIDEFGFALCSRIKKSES